MNNPTLTAAKALREAADALFQAFETLATTIPSGDAPETTPPDPQEVSKPEPVVEQTPATPTDVVAAEGATLEQIREVMAGLSKAGRSADARALLKRLGYTKLTEIPESLYDQVLPMARELADA